jgi:hypothetical protein
MDYRKLLKALLVLALGVIMGKPIMTAVGSAVDSYEAASSATQTAVKQSDSQ